jgi:hypothetical protein
MKNLCFIKSCFIFVLLALGAVGCASTSVVTQSSALRTNEDGTVSTSLVLTTNVVSKLDVTNTAAIARSVVASGTFAAITLQPDLTNDFRMAYVSYKTVFDGQRWDAATVSNSLAGVGVTNQQVIAAVIAGGNLVNALVKSFGRDLTENEYLYIVTEMSNGVADGFAMAGVKLVSLGAPCKIERLAVLSCRD